MSRNADPIELGGVLRDISNNSCEGGKPISSFSKDLFFLLVIFFITWSTYKTPFSSCYFFFLYFISSFFVFADSSICHRGFTCPALGNLSSCVFLERREGWWRDLGGNRSVFVFPPAGGINHFLRLEDWKWKPRMHGETNEVWLLSLCRNQSNCESTANLNLWWYFLVLTQGRISNLEYFDTSAVFKVCLL